MTEKLCYIFRRRESLYAEKMASVPKVFIVEVREKLYSLERIKINLRRSVQGM